MHPTYCPIGQCVSCEIIRLKVLPLASKMTKELLKDVFEEFEEVDSIKIL